MPTCTNCGGEDFIEDCGHFYCQVCQVQSQDIRVEEHEFEDHHNKTLTKTPTTKKQSVEEKQKDKLNRLGRPWTIYEGYQCVIKKQVQRLIELGADEKLDEIVFRCWTAYLSALHVAFCEKEKLIPPRYHTQARAREVFCGPIENPVVKVVRKKRNKEASRKEIERMEITHELGSEIFYDEDNPALEDEDNVFSGGSVNADPTILRPINSRLKYDVDWINMEETLSFLYLGLLFTNNHVTPSELISLAEKDQIPYSSATSCLKADMKISSYDSKLFYAAILPTTNDVRNTTSKLIKFLSIYELPPLPVDIIVSKLLLKLDLPAEFGCLVRNVLKLRELNMEIDINHSIKNVELVAVCYIIMTLKLYFGVNDSTEHVLTDCSRKLSKIFSNHNLFIWEDWQSHISSKFKIKQQIRNHNTRGTDKMTDVEEFVKLYNATTKNQNEKSLKKKAKNKQFEAVVDNITEFANRIRKPRPVNNILLETQNPLDLLNGSIDGDFIPDTEERIDGERFRRSSIKYLMSAEDLITQYQRRGLTSFTVESSYCGSPERENDFSDLESGNEFPPQQVKKKRKKSKTQQAVENILSQAPPGTTSITDAEREEVESIIETIQAHSGQYINYERPKKVFRDLSVRDSYEFQRHISYEWLLSMFCKIVRCRIDDLELMLTSFESILFGRKKDFQMCPFESMYFKK
ncbi:hypothetical protein SNE40_022851 [Patella caerulea]|uniref:TATA box-binding protein-associated factor RNA polymerase I subunit B n=1 Tax=Patella caerulea TaxID=87958 RepID=A0AAN8GG09_PATCE